MNLAIKLLKKQLYVGEGGFWDKIKYLCKETITLKKKPHQFKIKTFILSFNSTR